MGAWFEKWLVEQLLKSLTPDAVKVAEAQAAQFICCKLAALAKTTSTTLDDAVVAVVANALGVDLSKCPA